MTWAARGAELAVLAAQALARGIRLGVPVPGRRLRADGASLNWELTDPFEDRDGGVLPFFIDWGDRTHPASAAPAEIALADFHAEGPDPVNLELRLRALGLDLRVERGARPRILARLYTPKGPFTLVG